LVLRADPIYGHAQQSAQQRGDPGDLASHPIQLGLAVKLLC
jgi:hypothetical protein